MRKHKVKHPKGGTITSLIMTHEERARLDVYGDLPSWETDLYLTKDYPYFRKKCGVRTKYFCISEEEKINA